MALKLARENLDEKIIIISITDKGERCPKFAENKNILDILKLRFDDVEAWEYSSIDSCKSGGVVEHLMSDADAQSIIAFVNKYVNSVDRIVVHCNYGVSRSAAVCAAIMFLLNENDSKVFCNDNYEPNIYCYRTVLQAYFNHCPFEESEDNIVKYRQLHAT